MQRKKSSILLISVLCVTIGILVLSNLTGVLFRAPVDNTDALKAEAAKEAAPKEVTEADKQRTKEAMLGASAKRTQVKAVGEDGEGGAPAGNPATPSILIPEQKSYKPTYNETSTSGHWYDKNSNEGKRGEELAAKRNQ